MQVGVSVAGRLYLRDDPCQMMSQRRVKTKSSSLGSMHIAEFQRLHWKEQLRLTRPHTHSSSYTISCSTSIERFIVVCKASSTRPPHTHTRGILARCLSFSVARCQKTKQLSNEILGIHLP